MLPIFRALPVAVVLATSSSASAQEPGAGGAAASAPATADELTKRVIEELEKRYRLQARLEEIDRREEAALLSDIASHVGRMNAALTGTAFAAEYARYEARRKHWLDRLVPLVGRDAALRHLAEADEVVRSGYFDLLSKVYGTRRGQTEIATRLDQSSNYLKAVGGFQLAGPVSDEAWRIVAWNMERPATKLRRINDVTKIGLITSVIVFAAAGAGAVAVSEGEFIVDGQWQPDLAGFGKVGLAGLSVAGAASTIGFAWWANEQETVNVTRYLEEANAVTDGLVEDFAIYYAAATISEGLRAGIEKFHKRAVCDEKASEEERSASEACRLRVAMESASSFTRDGYEQKVGSAAQYEYLVAFQTAVLALQDATERYGALIEQRNREIFDGSIDRIDEIERRIEVTGDTIELSSFVRQSIDTLATDDRIAQIVSSNLDIRQIEAVRESVLAQAVQNAQASGGSVETGFDPGLVDRALRLDAVRKSIKDMRAVITETRKQSRSLLGAANQSLAAARSELPSIVQSANPRYDDDKKALCQIVATPATDCAAALSRYAGDKCAVQADVRAARVASSCATSVAVVH